MSKSFVPPKAVRQAARRGQALRASLPPSRRCCTAVGIARGKQLAEGRRVSVPDLVAMRAYFARHEVDRNTPGWGLDSKGYQAWLLWGGDPGRAWAQRTLAKLERMRDNPTNMPSVEALADEGQGSFEDYYPDSAAGALELDEDSAYRGRNVIWDGTEGRMFRVDPLYMRSIEGNLFDPDKLAAIRSGIEEADEPVVFRAPYGQAYKIDIDRVKESLEYTEDEALDRPYSTGDDDLDEYLVRPEEALEPYGEPGDEEYEEAKADFEKRLKRAIQRDEGDLGAWAFTIRDGNHRAFGAVLAGEPYVWARITDNDYQYLMDAKKRRALTEEQRELLDLLE